MLVGIKTSSGWPCESCEGQIV